MDFELADDQTMLREGLRALLDGACPPSRVRSVAFEGSGADPELWSTLSASGWPALNVPEQAGGAGLGFEELMLVAMETGRAALHVPLVTTLLAARAIAAAPGSTFRDDMLRQIAEGIATVTLSVRGDPGDYNGEREPVQAVVTASGWSLHGTLHDVPYGPAAHTVLAEVSTASGPALALLPTDDAGAEWTDLGVMDRATPRFRAGLRNVSVPPEAVLYGEASAANAVAELTDEYRAALAAESQGASERMLEMAVQYAKDREQFGRPIGSNQAVKVRIAQMGAAVERMRAAVYFAAMQLQQQGAERHRAVAMAKAATAAPAAFVGSQAIHVHGAIGFTWEHDLHFWVKRVKSNELLLGAEAEHLARLADELFGPVGK